MHESKNIAFLSHEDATRHLFLLVSTVPLLGAIVPHFFPLLSLLPKSFPHFISFIYMKYSFLCIFPAPFLSN